MTDKDHIQSIEKCFVILDCLHSTEKLLNLETISRLAGYKKTTCFRILKTLKTLGLVEMADNGKQYRYGTRLAALGLSALKNLNLRQSALPILQRLRDETGETVNLSILNGSEIVFVERVMSDYLVNININVGDRLPVFCASMGKAILAHVSGKQLEEILDAISFSPRTDRTIVSREQLLKELKEIRKNGFAINDEELERGLRAVAAPVFNYTGEAFAAVNIAWTTARHPDPSTFGDYARKIIEAGRRISWLMGFNPGK
ncbi:MAG: IclR family transcriptional regulator [Pseudomonadota bacterium]